MRVCVCVCVCVCVVVCVCVCVYVCVYVCRKSSNISSGPLFLRWYQTMSVYLREAFIKRGGFY